MKGNRRDQEEIDQILQGNWLAETMADILNSTETAESEEEADEVLDGERTHPKVAWSGLPATEAYEPWYDTIELAYAWIAGFRPYMYWANTTNCFHRMSNMTYHEIPEFQ